MPTRWAADVFAAGGVARHRLLVVPEPVDTAYFDPATVDMAAYYAAHPHPDSQAGNSAAAGGEGASGGAQSFIPGRTCGDGGAGRGSSPSCPIRFLSIGKWERRKAFDILLRAFLSEFMGGSAPYVELWIMTSSYHSDGDFRGAIDGLVDGPLACDTTRNTTTATTTPTGLLAAIASRSLSCVPRGLEGRPQLPPIRLLSDVPQREMPSVYASVDAFVLPSRGEGWGRPHVEAMAMGLPVIATLWSGPSEYMTPDNSFPLSHSGMVPIPEGAFAGHLQAEPNGTHLRELLAGVAADLKAAGVRGARARRDMVDLYSPERVGRFVAHHLARLLLEVSTSTMGDDGEGGGSTERSEL